MIIQHLSYGVTFSTQIPAFFILKKHESAFWEIEKMLLSSTSYTVPFVVLLAESKTFWKMQSLVKAVKCFM